MARRFSIDTGVSRCRATAFAAQPLSAASVAAAGNDEEARARMTELETQLRLEREETTNLRGRLADGVTLPRI